MRNWAGFKWAMVGGLVVGIVMVMLPVAAVVGDPILAGVTNLVDEQTRLKGNTDDPNLKVTNTNPDGMAASFNVEPGNPPFKVSSGERVKLLNADRVDGKHVGALLTKNDYDTDDDGLVDDAEQLDGKTGADYLNASNIDSGTLSTSRFDAYTDLGDDGRLDNNSGNDLLTRSQLDSRYINEGDGYTFPQSAAGGWYGTVPQGTDEDVIQVPSGIVVTDFLFSFPSNSACKVTVAKGSSVITNFHLGGNSAESLSFDVGIASANDVTVNLGSISASSCTASVTWTGYSTPGFVAGHGYGTITLDDPTQTTFTETLIPSGTVLGSIGASIPFTTLQDKSSNCEIRVRQEGDDLLRARHNNTDFEPFIVNLGAGIPSNGDVWIGVRNHGGPTPGCIGPIYWTTRTTTTPLVP